jgi:hypothetical protein
MREWIEVCCQCMPVKDGAGQAHATTNPEYVPLETRSEPFRATLTGMVQLLVLEA